MQTAAAYSEILGMYEAEDEADELFVWGHAAAEGKAGPGTRPVAEGIAGSGTMR